MTERLRLIDSDIEAVTWDAYRGDDGTWQVTGAWRAGDKSGTTRWSFDLPSRTVAPSDAATMDFAEGTRLVRVVPDVPAGLAAAPVAAAASRSCASPPGRGRPRARHHHPRRPARGPRGARATSSVRDVHAATGTPDDDRSIDALLDEVAEHDTVVLGRTGEEPEDEDPRARIPAWEDIVFGVRRHR